MKIAMRFKLASAVLLIALMIFSIAGCKPVQKDPLLGLCLPPAGEGWSGSLLPYAKAAAEDWGGRFTVETAPEIPGSLLSAAEEFIKQKADLVVMYAYDPQEGALAAAALAEHKIPLILVGNPIDGDDYAALISADNRAVGRAAGEYLAQRLSGAGSVLVLEGIPGEVTDLRNEGFREALSQHPGITILAGVNCGGHRDIAKTEVMLQMQDHPDIAAIFAHSDEMALGAIESLEAVYANLQAVVSIGGSKEAIASLQKNHRYWKAAWAYPPSIAAEAVNLAVANLAGEPLPEDKIVLKALEKIDPTNALACYDENALY